MSRYRKQECINPKCSNVQRMPKHSLCFPCERKLERYDQLKSDFEKLESRKLENFRLPHGESFIGGFRQIGQDDPEIAEFDKRFKDLLESIAVSSGESNFGINVSLNGRTEYHRKTGFTFSLTTDDYTFRRFLYSITNLCKRSYAHGVDYGRNLLMQLNEGEITPMQLDGKVDDVNRI